MEASNSLLVVIDVQGKLATMMHDQEHLIPNIQRAIHVSQLLDVPILWTEQAPDKIGPTIDPIAQELFPLVKPIVKRSFSCFQEPSFRKAIDESLRQQILLVGIETHVCVYETARDLKRHGYEVFVAEDAVSSKTRVQKDITINRMRQEGMHIVSVEMVGCDWMVDANHPKFRDVMISIKR